MRYFKFSSLVLCSVLLTACVETAFVAGATTGGLIVYDQRGMQTILADQEIHQQAFLKIKRDETLRQKMHVVVASFNRIVLLTGQVPNLNARARIGEHIRSIPGVKRIYNELTVCPPTNAVTRSKDTMITTLIKSKLLLDNGLRASQIKVVTENGTVYLLGVVSRKQADLAVNISREISGVQRVVKLFEYITPADL